MKDLKMLKPKVRRVGLYHVILTDTSEKKDKDVYNWNVPFPIEGPLAISDENIIDWFKFLQPDLEYDKIKFNYIRDLLEIEK